MNDIKINVMDRAAQVCEQWIEVGADHGIFSRGAQREFYCGQWNGRHQSGWVVSQIAGRADSAALLVIRSAIESLGGRIDQVIRTRMFVKDVSKWEEIAKVHGEIFGEIRPATAILQIAKLIDEEALIEIEADAIVEER